jgi:hypothetical protein
MLLNDHDAGSAFPFLLFAVVITHLADVKNAYRVILCNANYMLAPKYRKEV